MDRRKVYQGQEVLDDDELWSNRFAMIGLARQAMSIMGTTDTVSGLVATPGAGLNVTIGVGEVYQLQAVDANAYGNLAPDAHTAMKQGLLSDPATIAVPAPITGGQSIVYLIEAQLQESDTDATVLPYYNVSNPTSPWTGPNGDGTANTTTRKDVAVVQAKAGTPATTGSQLAPAVDAGWVAIYTVTIANGAVSVAAANITKLKAAPFIDLKITDMRKPAFRALFHLGKLL